MVKIKLGNNEKYVTKGAYKEFYEHLGYEIVGNEKPFVKETKTAKETEDKKETKKEDKSKLENYSRK